MFYSASAFNHDISSWTGTAATTAQGAVVFWRDCISSQILVRRRHHRTGEFVRCNQNLLGRTFSASFSSLTTSPSLTTTTLSLTTTSTSFSSVVSLGAYESFRGGLGGLPRLSRVLANSRY